MDNKTWLWRKKSSEKTIIATYNANLVSKGNEEIQKLLADKEELEKDMKRVNDKLALALHDCNAKDELVRKQTKIAQEAMAGWEKADAEVLSMKKDHDEALQQRLVYEERVAHLERALNDCMQQPWNHNFHTNRVLEDQIQNHEKINSDLDAQHTEAELKESHHKVLALEVELENKNHCCGELEARCLELPLQFESLSKECLDHGNDQKDKPLQTDWEVTAASEKLAECQETIFNLGKQLKALTAPKDAS